MYVKSCAENAIQLFVKCISVLSKVPAGRYKNGVEGVGVAGSTG
ncbi:hypothetical protein CUZ56_00907 [Saezia sanguinis]|uniref:Uncharacterized protein n=1 Tax=Saezia sanguinis TaxID=1965230 RepID=A0A433SE06_9BURK|nr:hypothetical protein CUZ56_00907 [Saezia sanguinis]